MLPNRTNTEQRKSSTILVRHTRDRPAPATRALHFPYTPPTRAPTYPRTRSVPYSCPRPMACPRTWPGVSGIRLRATRRYEETVAWCARSAGLSAALTGQVSLTIRLWFPDRRCRDIDNVGKAIMEGRSEPRCLGRRQPGDSAGGDRISPRAEIRISPSTKSAKAEVSTHPAGYMLNCPLCCSF